MANKKLIHEIPAEELLKVVGESDEEIDVGKLTDAAKFIYQFNVKAGDTKVLASLIYYTYKKWIGKDKAEPKWKFFRDFSKYFEKKHIRSQTFYYLNPKPFDMSKETWWEIRREIRHTREVNRRRREAKKNAAKENNEAQSSKVPGSNEEVQ